MRFASLLLVSCLAAHPLCAQAMVGYASVAGATSTAAAGAGKSAGKALESALKKSGDQLAAAGSKSVTTVPRAKGRAAAGSKRPLPLVADFDEVKEGMDRKGLLARLGPPSSSFSTSEEGKLIETLSYATNDGGKARVQLIDGTVTKIDRPAPRPAIE